ncbi:hypothetical protein ALC57_04963, partial [Trachymyrmex cornetzi]
LNRIIKTGKDKLNKDELSNVVYEINCADCNVSYVGQTKRQLNTRIKEHNGCVQQKKHLCNCCKILEYDWFIHLDPIRN